VRVACGSGGPPNDQNDRAVDEIVAGDAAAGPTPPPERAVRQVAGAASDEVDFTGLLTWARRQDAVRWALAGVIAVWTITFFVLGKIRHDRFGTFSFDLGTYDQAVWLLAHFRMFDTVRGLNIFGHHMNVVLLLLAPFYRLGAGPEFLLAVQVLAQASGAVAIYLLARDRLADRWLGVVLGAVLLLNPTYQFLVWEFFHPDTLAIAPVLFAYWAARAHRWGWFTVAAVLAVACKEDVALVLIVIGVLVAVRDNVRIGVVTSALSTLWYVIATRVLMKHFLGGLNPFYDSYFGDLGNSVWAVVKTALLRPGTTFDLATRGDRITYYGMIFTPVAFLCFLAPASLLVALPMLAVNALTTFPYARVYQYHYSALVVAGIMVATVEAIAAVGRTPRVRRLLAGLVAAASLGTTVAWGISPISVLFNDGYWPLHDDARVATQRTALGLIPKTASVSAIYSYVPHLTHRTHIYDFPEPWKRVNWGVNGENLPDPAGVQWIAVDRLLTSAYDNRLIAALLASQFTVRFDRDGVLIAQRTAPGSTVSLPAG
jgi:uncharacterized membrane protein